jgi:hypothetical protein
VRRPILPFSWSLAVRLSLARVSFLGQARWKRKTEIEVDSFFPPKRASIGRIPEKGIGISFVPNAHSQFLFSVLLFLYFSFDIPTIQTTNTGIY